MSTVLPEGIHFPGEHLGKGVGDVLRIHHGLDVRVLLEPVEFHGSTGFDEKNHVLVVVIKVFDDFGCGGVKLDVALLLVFLLVGVVVHGTRHCQSIRYE